jgi:hypothetical protein
MERIDAQGHSSAEVTDSRGLDAEPAEDPAVHSLLHSTLTLGGATARDLVRRPGFAIGGVALVALLGPLPRLGNPAASAADNGALAVEMGLASVGIASSLGAGFAGIRVTSDEEGTGVAEFHSAPISATTYLLGRTLGIVTVVGVGLVAVLAISGLVWTMTGSTPRLDPPSAVVLGIAGMWVAAATFAPLGMLLGAWLPARLAGVLLVLLFALSRTFPPPDGVTFGLADAVGAFLPPAPRLDFAREVAFGRTISTAGVALGAVAAACTGAAALFLAAHRVERRERGC